MGTAHSGISAGLSSSLSSLLLIVVILLQESKGGGLAEAFGGIGAETFGVKSGGINRFTFALAGPDDGRRRCGIHWFWNVG